MKEVRSSSVSICCVLLSAVPVGRKTSPNKGIHPYAYQGYSSETPPNNGSILSGRQYLSSKTPGLGDFHYLRHWSVDFFPNSVLKVLNLMDQPVNSKQITKNKY